ncbi:MAG: type II secretion system major pseudopilin GspG [Candidatus Marithrix sp.]
MLIKTKQSGFSLIWLLVVIVILGLFVALIMPLIFSGGYTTTRISTTATQISSLEIALDIYRLDMFKYPSSLEALVKNTTNSPKWQGPYLKKRIPKDPWGNEYKYEKRIYYIYSFGADGKRGGEGINADIFDPYSLPFNVINKPKKIGFPLSDLIAIIIILSIIAAFIIWQLRKRIAVLEAKIREEFKDKNST